MTRRAFLALCHAAHLTVRVDAYDEVTVQGVRVVWHRPVKPKIPTAIVRVKDRYALHVVLARHGGGWRIPKRVGMHSIRLGTQWAPPTRSELCRLLWRRDRALMRARARVLAHPAGVLRGVRVIGEG